MDSSPLWGQPLFQADLNQIVCSSVRSESVWVVLFKPYECLKAGVMCFAATGEINKKRPRIPAVTGDEPTLPLPKDNLQLLWLPFRVNLLPLPDGMAFYTWCPGTSFSHIKAGSIQSSASLRQWFNGEVWKVDTLCNIKCHQTNRSSGCS